MPPLIDGFTDLVEIGRGGFGTVYRARQHQPARDVAVKVLPDVRADSEAYGRFTREFQALAAVGGHPNIARVHACGVTDDGSGYLALELLTGGSLADRVQAGPQPWVDVASWGVQLSGALETAHRAGITHRDLKPENVLFDAKSTPQLVDFGIAGVPGAFRTATGSVTLTLAHAAPEVVAGARGGVPGDIYALASTLHAALAGRVAFAAETDETLVPMLARIATAPVPDLRPAGVPDSVCAVIERGMSKDPADRPASAEALGVGLRAALAGEGVGASAPRLLLAPGVAAPFLISPSAPPVGASASADAGGARDDERTLTGWVAPASTPARDGRRRRRYPLWGAAAAALALVVSPWVWGGGDPPAPAAVAPSTTPTPDASPTPSSSRTGSSTPTPVTSSSSSPSAAASSTRPKVVAQAPPAVSPSSRRTGSGASPSSTPDPAPTATSTTPPPATAPRPAKPRTVLAGGLSLSEPGGAPAQVSVTLSWSAAPTGPAASAYEVRWITLGGPQRGTRTLAATTTATSADIVVAAPAAGVRYRWQVRSVAGSRASGWVGARVTLPDLVGRRAVQARTALHAGGVGASFYAVTATTRAMRRHVLAQSVPAGRVVTVASSVALGIGRAP